MLASLLAHQVDEGGTRLQDHDEVRARTVPSTGPPALENYLHYTTLPTAGSAGPCAHPRQQTTPRHTGISLGDAIAREADQPREARKIQDWVPKTTHDAPSHRYFSRRWRVQEGQSAGLLTAMPVWRHRSQQAYGLPTLADPQRNDTRRPAPPVFL